MLADAQTAGGLLITVPEKKSSLLLDKLNDNSKYTSKSVDQIFNGIVKIPTPAEAAAAAAEVEKKRRAKEARAKEAERQRRFRQEQMNRMLGGNHRGVFNQFFGVGTKQEDPTTKAKVNLAIKLAQGDIDQTTFNAAMDAFN